MNNRTMDFNDHVCKECGRHFKNRRAVGNHTNRAHNMPIQEYVLKHMFGGVIPKCICGCGNDVAWHKALYKYNDYITGHNEAGYARSDWKPTQDQIDSRNEAIRKAYLKKGNKIKKKISDSLKETFSQPGMSKKLSQAQREGWSKPGVKEKASVIRKRVWAEQHDELYEKIFTPESRQKISLANTNREMTRASKKEQAFKDHLESVLGEAFVKKGRWLNREDCVKHYSGFIPPERLLVEFDGTHLHGLDREENFTAQQLNNMANDFIKNRLAASANFELIRISDDINFSAIKTLNDLRNAAYHHQLKGGTVVLDGMFRFKSDKHAIISREALIRINESDIFPNAFGRTFTEEKILPAVRQFFREYVKSRGWFYPSSKDTLQTTMDSLKNYPDIVGNEISSLTNTGVSYLKSIFKSYWEVDKGPVSSFWKDKNLDSVLKYRLGLNNSKQYDYILSDDKKVSCRETFDINIKNIRYGFIVQRQAVSFFKPTASKQLYRYILGDMGSPRPRVWDPSAGFGARMLGFAAAYPKGMYFANEPAEKTFNDNKQLASNIQALENEFNVKLFKQGSEEPLNLKDIDLVFTSPPYFDREKYFDDDTQCWKKFPQSDDWRDKFLFPTFVNAFKMLKKEGKLVINIDKLNKENVIVAAQHAGFILSKELKLRIGRDHFGRKAKHAGSNSEPILIFSKA